jgi:predicted ATPase
MPFVILTGGPGAGKTALLSELASLGYPTVDETARAIIADRLARGLSPRPALSEFAHEILRQDIAKYIALRQTAREGPADRQHVRAWTFFDRGLVDALGLVQDVAPMPAADTTALLATYPFHPLVFILPPWEAIYVTDAERDQSFTEAVAVHGTLARWYGACGYELHEVPRLPVAERARYVLRVLAEAGDVIAP